MAEATLTIRFEDQAELAAWFLTARKQGLIEQQAGVRPQDALDPGGRGAKGVFIVAADGAIDGWLVQPAPAQEAERDEEACRCGHTRRWHGDQGEGQGTGPCENDPDCACQVFTPQVST